MECTTNRRAWCQGAVTPAPRGRRYERENVVEEVGVGKNLHGRHIRVTGIMMRVRHHDHNWFTTQAWVEMLKKEAEKGSVFLQPQLRRRMADRQTRRGQDVATDEETINSVCIGSTSHVVGLN